MCQRKEDQRKEGTLREAEERSLVIDTAYALNDKIAAKRVSA